MTALSPRCRFSGTALKTIACITMLVDHIGASCIEAGLLLPELETGEVSGGAWDQLSLFQLDRVLRFTGRLAFPIFCFLLVEGFVHTHDFRKYALRMLGFALLSEFPFDWAFFSGVWWGHQNVYFTLLLGLSLIHISEPTRP